MNKNLIVAVLIIVVVGVGGYVLIKNKSGQKAIVADSSQKSGDCPYILGEGEGYQVLMDQCNPVSFEGAVLEGQYTTPTITVLSTDNSFKNTYTISREFVPNFGSGGRLQLSSDKSYLFMDEGTWVVRSLTVFSLVDDRVKQIQYIHTPVITKNGFLVYNAPSQTFPDAHPEVDQSAATDVVVMKLSDFSTKNLFIGDTKTDYSLFIDWPTRQAGEFLSGIQDDVLTINKIFYNDPADLSVGSTKTQITVPISSL